MNWWIIENYILDFGSKYISIFEYVLAWLLDPYNGWNKTTFRKRTSPHITPSIYMCVSLNKTEYLLRHLRLTIASYYPIKFSSERVGKILFLSHTHVYLPQFLKRILPFIKILEGKHPCIIFWGSKFMYLNLGCY